MSERATTMDGVFTITHTGETTPTPVDELPPVRRQLHRRRPIEPFTDWDALERRRAADPELAADIAFANRIASFRHPRV